MWKESYRIGIEPIDTQHRELFRMVDGLMRDIEQNAGRDRYEASIQFLKDYVVFHFHEEEHYQASIGFSEQEEHRQAHQAFAGAVLDHERRLEESGYDLPEVKALMGTLTAWLIYHVREVDQRMAGAQTKEEVPVVPNGGDLELFSGSVLDVLQAMTGLKGGHVTGGAGGARPIAGEVFIRIALTGAREGGVLFGFSRDLTLRLVELLTLVELDEVDELVCSVLAELSHIACGNAVAQLAGHGVLCGLRPPEVFRAGELDYEALSGAWLETGIGGLEVAVRLD